MKICIYTLGCKVNQYESGGLTTALLAKGHEVTDQLSKADVYIINTCAVTMEAERKSRSSVAKCLSYNENAKVFVVGCASQNNLEQFAKKKGVVYVNGNGAKTKVLELLEEEEITPLPEAYEEYLPAENSRTRAFVKVQDGCNNFCSYCIVPYLRGRSRSRSIESVIEEVKSHDQCNEIVLCGINLSDYKFGGLIALSEEVDKYKRFRFGSLEVNVITDEFLQRLKKLKNFCPQFHLSLQSGSTEVLKKMNRRYTATQYIEAVEKIKSVFPNANITTDVIVGFPTETEENFVESCNLAKTVGFGDMHIFPYSKRTGTVAASFPDLPKEIKSERAKRLAEIRDELKRAYIEKNLGKSFVVLTEEFVGGNSIGHTENFIKVYLKGEIQTNALLQCKLTEVYKDGAKGELI